MIFAIIDLGTNTFNLLIAERFLNNTFRKIFNTKIAVKLGEGSINSGYIGDVPFQRGLKALEKYQQYLLYHNVSQVYAYGTSAIRSASNGKEFVEQAQKIVGIAITVIDGDEEADLIYYGNRMAINMTDDVSLIMDIGGGSTEFILATKNEILWKQSFLLGAARLLSKFEPSDPIKPDEINDFNNYLTQELKPLFEAVKKYKPIELIGSSGAFDSVVDMIAAEFNTEAMTEDGKEYPINLSYYKCISDKIIASTIQERHHIKGLISMRVDMMVISVLLIDFVLREFDLKNMRVSAFSLKEGVISKKLGLTLC